MVLKTLSLNIIFFILTLIPILIAVAYIILAERKVMASIQRRKGPNVVGFFGLLQPFIDAVKLLTKEHIFPTKANQWVFVFGPIFTLSIAILSWSFIPFNYTNFYYDYTYSLLLLLTFSSLSVYGIVLSGWASNSKYALLGSIRTIAQFISYELVLTISVFPIILITHSLNFIEIVLYQAQTVWFIIPFWPFAYIFFIASLAETNRTPFDLPEAEAELVAGYNVEYSSVFFILFMFAEYSNIMLMSALFSLLFLGGWDGGLHIINQTLAGEFIFACKITIVSFFFIVVRATQPRLRFDQLLTLCWKRLLPLVFALFIGCIFLYITFSVYVPTCNKWVFIAGIGEVITWSFLFWFFTSSSTNSNTAGNPPNLEPKDFKPFLYFILMILFWDFVSDMLFILLTLFSDDFAVFAAWFSTTIIFRIIWGIIRLVFFGWLTYIIAGIIFICNFTTFVMDYDYVGFENKINSRAYFFWVAVLFFVVVGILYFYGYVTF